MADTYDYDINTRLLLKFSCEGNVLDTVPTESVKTWSFQLAATFTDTTSLSALVKAVGDKMIENASIFKYKPKKLLAAWFEKTTTTNVSVT